MSRKLSHTPTCLVHPSSLVYFYRGRAYKLASVHWLDVRSVFRRVACARGLSAKHGGQQHRHLATHASDQYIRDAQQPDTFFTPALSSHLSPPEPRFDWRLRASKQKPISNGLNPRYKRRAEPESDETTLGSNYFLESETYRRRFQPLLDAEQAEEEALVKERLASWSVQRLKHGGYCLTDTSAYWLENTRFETAVAAFSLGPGVTLPQHKFNNGAQVLVSRFDPLKEKDTARRGRVLRATPTQLQVSFEQTFDLTEDGGKWRLDVGISDVMYERMRAAMATLSDDPIAQEAASVADDREIILRGTALRDVLLRSFKPGARYGVGLKESEFTDDFSPNMDEDDAAASYEPSDTKSPATPLNSAHPNTNQSGRRRDSSASIFAQDMRIMSWARRFSRIDPIHIEGDPQLELDSAQVRAIATMIAQRASLVQGPPGTGKTRTIIEAVRLIKKEFDVAIPILVCTYTNVAVDNLVEGFVASGLNAVRVGFEGNIKDSLAECTLPMKLERHPRHKDLEMLYVDRDKKKARLEIYERELKLLQSKPTNPKRQVYIQHTLNAISRTEQRLNRLGARAYGLKAHMTQDLFNEADVICSTSLSAAHQSFRLVDFPVVFLDEASMSTEPASLIPLVKGCRHVSLIGDHKQLPPVILSDKAREQGLALSLFERLTEEGVVPSVMLNTQYRMHPSIAMFPSNEFYNKALKNGTVDKLGNVPDRLLPPSSQHLLPSSPSAGRPSVVFLDHRGPESKSGRSYVNWTDAAVVCSVINDLLLTNPDLKGSDIGVIAPYAAQVSLLHRLVNSDAHTLERFQASLGDHRAMQLGDIEVKTVDGYEGREKDVIIFSTVRNNSAGQIGFLADRRRLNVGLTRAKRGLFVVGSLRTLGSDHTRQRAMPRVREAAVGTASEMAEDARTRPPDVEEFAPARRSKGSTWARYVAFLEEGNLIRSVEGASLHSMLGERNGALPTPPADARL